VAIFHIKAHESLPRRTEDWAQKIPRDPAPGEVNRLQEMVCGEFSHLPRSSHQVSERYDIPKLRVFLVPARDTVCRYYDAPKLTIVWPRVGTWTGMLLFSLGFYYGLARLVMWAASL
jgi:hypothetical protein